MVLSLPFPKLLQAQHMGFPFFPLPGIDGAGPGQPSLRHPHARAASLWQGAGKAELWHQSTARRNLVPPEVAEHPLRGWGHPVTSFLGQSGRDARGLPWESSGSAALGICHPREKMRMVAQGQ